MYMNRSKETNQTCARTGNLKGSITLKPWDKNNGLDGLVKSAAVKDKSKMKKWGVPLRCYLAEVR
jgi:hypothetical protein